MFYKHTFHPQPQQHPPASGMSSMTLLFSGPLSMSLLCALEFSSLFEDKIKLQDNKSAFTTKDDPTLAPPPTTLAVLTL